MEENTENTFREAFEGRVKTTTLDELPALLKELIESEHDYGTICVAMGIAAATTAWAMNKHRNAWLFGLANQALWLIWILATGAYGLLPMNAALWIVYGRNHLKWSRA